MLGLIFWSAVILISVAYHFEKKDERERAERQRHAQLEQERLEREHKEQAKRERQRLAAERTRKQRQVEEQLRAQRSGYTSASAAKRPASGHSRYNLPPSS